MCLRPSQATLPPVARINAALFVQDRFVYSRQTLRAGKMSSAFSLFLYNPLSTIQSFPAFDLLQWEHLRNFPPVFVIKVHANTEILWLNNAGLGKITGKCSADVPCVQKHFWHRHISKSCTFSSATCHPWSVAFKRRKSPGNLERWRHNLDLISLVVPPHNQQAPSRPAFFWEASNGLIGIIGRPRRDFLSVGNGINWNYRYKRVCVLGLGLN